MMAGIVPAARHRAVSMPMSSRLKMTFFAVFTPLIIIFSISFSPCPILNAHRENIKSPASSAYMTDRSNMTQTMSAAANRPNAARCMLIHLGYKYYHCI